MTVGQVIRFTSGFFPTWNRDLETRYVKSFDLPLERKTTRLSKGMHSKLMILLALARGAELLILDEPTDGLDPAMVEDVLRAIVTASAEHGTTVFFSSHHLTEVEQIADRVTIIESGRAVLSEQLDDLRANYRIVDVSFEGDPKPAALRVAGVERIDGEGRMLSMLVSRNVEAVVENARAQAAVSVDVRPISLKEIFLGTVKGVGQ